MALPPERYLRFTPLPPAGALVGMSLPVDLHGREVPNLQWTASAVRLNTGALSTGTPIRRLADEGPVVSSVNGARRVARRRSTRPVILISRRCMAIQASAFRPSRRSNLAVQSAIDAGARPLCQVRMGGFAYLAPLCGVSAVRLLHRNPDLVLAAACWILCVIVNKDRPVRRRIRT
jgi:hypothetical protein